VFIEPPLFARTYLVDDDYVNSNDSSPWIPKLEK
jgi:hypothetical protein